MRQLALFSPDPAELVPLAVNGGARLVSIDPKQNRFRFYTFTCEQTLWREWAIRCTWGRIGGMGRSRIAYVGHEAGLGVPVVFGQKRVTRNRERPSYVV